MNLSQKRRDAICQVVHDEMVDIRIGVGSRPGIIGTELSMTIAIWLARRERSLQERLLMAIEGKP